MNARPFSMLFALLASTTTFAGSPPRDAPAMFDRYGYANFDAAPSCPSSFIDIAASGTPLTLTASGTPLATDDGAAALPPLAQPFELYGAPVSGFVASSNGYLAAASSLGAEDGGDFSNDCPLPALADNAVATQSRIMVLHDDLDGGSGTLATQYFSTCPRVSDSGAVEACTVVEWANWSRVNVAGSFDAEVVLYHTTFEIAVQFRNLQAAYTQGATIGLQNSDATSSSQYACNGSHSVAPAACFFDPRFPPGSLGVADRIFGNGFDTTP